jgi:fatty-acyl-CoA synthase
VSFDEFPSNLASAPTRARQHLAGYKVPKVIVLVEPDALPLNPSGKIVKRDVRVAMGW